MRKAEILEKESVYTADASSRTYIALNHVSVGYNKKTLIHDICMDIKKGEIVTLIGPNGAGKSTILKSMTRQLSLIGGRVILNENDLYALSYQELSKQLAVVLTDRMKPELMTCQDVVATGRYPYTGRFGILSRADEERVDAALRTVHAAEIGNRDFNAISDGQKQRVLLARALCQEPQVIVLDEPTSFLDIRYKLELLAILRRMAKEDGITVIMTLHEIDLAQKISDKIVCVNGETISGYGPPEEIFREEKIRDLYQIDNGFYDPLFGSIEMPRPQGDPKVLVISSGGSGIPVYRRLQKQGASFIAGILYRNDIDYQLARLLAAEVIAEEPFCEITDPVFEQARGALHRCEQVIYAGGVIGESNRRIQLLLDEAETLGKLTKAGLENICNSSTH